MESKIAQKSMKILGTSFVFLFYRNKFQLMSLLGSQNKYFPNKILKFSSQCSKNVATMSRFKVCALTNAPSPT